MVRFLFLLSLTLSFAFAGTAQAQLRPMNLSLPTANTALLKNDGPGYFQYVDRNFEGTKSSPWEGGQFGFVRDPRRVGSLLAYARFHEGMDVKPLERDAKGDPLDLIKAIGDGEVVYITASAGQSNYGRYIVIRHNWGYGPFYSLYAHLREARVTTGQKVASGETIGLMGYTGSGINQQRAHLHVELNLMWSSTFDQWHGTSFSTPNHHGLYNGINLVGLNLQDLYLAYHKNPNLTAAAAIRGTEATYEIAVPGTATMELAKNYPWLHEGPVPTYAASWRVRFSRWGLPVKVTSSNQPVAAPTITWIQAGPIPHFYNTKGHVSGSGDNATLTVSGLRFVKLACGLP